MLGCPQRRALSGAPAATALSQFHKDLELLEACHLDCKSPPSCKSMLSCFAFAAACSLQVSFRVFVRVLELLLSLEEERGWLGVL